MTVVKDFTILHPTTETKIHPPTTAAAKAAASMIATGRVAAYASDNPLLCRVKQLPKDNIVDTEDMEELRVAIDGPFSNATVDVEDDGEEELSIGPALLVREQRARAAKLYNNWVTWSLWYAHTSGMPGEGWVVDIDKCVCGCKFYAKFKTCCHVIVARKAKRLGRPGVPDKTEKLFNRQVRKVKNGGSSKQKKQAPTSDETTELPLIGPSHGRPLLASRALDLQFILSPDT
ncbi:hypothetical protein PF002_g20905 [Phytophthora fragariae]|uniref:SWIM-type domain-containing protein n=1 Tax=Phytophthora fragariae TaxID=53985 RepID=A0A6A3XKK2_9STRA|nr:hypothetical protein PF002_g20905 [Phytophthora fragariae]